MKIIAIVGFGFCGKLAFANIVKSLNKKDKILIFDKAQGDFKSAAFSPFSPHYILNVPVANMSAFSDDAAYEESFENFLKNNHSEIWKSSGKFGFVARQIYGEYLEEIVQKAQENAKKNGVNFEFVNQEVMAISDEFLITTKNNIQFQATEVLLATSFKQVQLPFEIESKKFIKALWNEDALEFHQKILTNETICLIGSGLTTVDVIVGLKKKNFSGKIIIISRRGNLPKKHLIKSSEKSSYFIDAEDAKKGVLFLCLKIRNFLKSNSQFDLRNIINSIRSTTDKLWHNLDEKNKKLFFRLMPYWNIFRHRAPISSIELIEEMIAAGQIEIVEGGVKKCQKLGDKISVQTKFAEFEVDYLVNCLGFEFNARKYPLLNQMIELGLLQQDFMMVRSNNDKVHLLGGLNIGRDFECTAVPDLRVNVEMVVRDVVGSS
jgi:uncharacterized NAD(P)/FAD-binding protein YdhS